MLYCFHVSERDIWSSVRDIGPQEIFKAEIIFINTDAAVEGDSVEIEERHIKSEKTKLLNDDRVNR